MLIFDKVKAAMKSAKPGTPKQNSLKFLFSEMERIQKGFAQPTDDECVKVIENAINDNDRLIADIRTNRAGNDTSELEAQNEWWAQFLPVYVTADELAGILKLEGLDSLYGCGQGKAIGQISRFLKAKGVPCKNELIRLYVMGK